MDNLTGLVNDLQRKLKEREIRIKKLETTLESVGIRPGDGSIPESLPEPVVLLQKVAELEKKNQSLQTELEEQQQKKGPDAMGDLAKELQIKLHKRDDSIAKLEAEVKQLRDDRGRAKTSPSSDIGNVLESGASKKDEIINQLESQIKENLRPKIIDLETKIRSLQSELEEVQQQKKNLAAMGDLAKELQIKLHKRDDTIAKLEVEVNQLRDRYGKAGEMPIPEFGKDFESELRKKDEIISKLESQIKGQLNPKIADLESKIQNLQAELGEQQQKKGPQMVGDLVKELQTKLHKRDETITKLDAEVKQLREKHGKGGEPLIPDKEKNLESELKKKDENIAKLERQIKEDLNPKIGELKTKILSLQTDLMDQQQKKGPAAVGDLVKELQTKLRKREDHLTKLDAEVKQLREKHGITVVSPIPEVGKNFESELRKKDEIIAKLESQIKMKESPRVEELEAKIRALQMELVESKQGIGTRVSGDLAKSLQTKAHSRDETISKLEMDAKRFHGDLESELKKKEEIIASLENQIKEMTRLKLPNEQRWWY
ncbi:MAG: hypothetical protein RBG13Loki_4083 [Promethearchaeota archaeon CR_4]|nr:MAG: hypothetical protein RBG13Loki_4083 [Candidatus Lokiarchaeota archaeon CR_4]